MKILKKFLMVFCFSIFLFGFTKVKAVEYYTSATISNIDRYLNTDKSLTDFEDLMRNNIDFETIFSSVTGGAKDNYYVIVSNGGYGDYSFWVVLLQSNNDIDLNVDTYGFHLYQRNGFYFYQFNITFDSNYENPTIDSSGWTYNIRYDLNNPMNYMFLFGSQDTIKYVAKSGWESLTIDFDGRIINNNDIVSLNNFNINYNNIVFPYDSQQNPEPILYTPQIQHFDGYDKVTYYIDNFTIESNEAGYQILIKNNTNGTIDNIPPDVNNINQVIIKEYYENSNITFGLYQWNAEEQQLDEIVYWNINTNIDYEENQDYSVVVNSVSNSQKIVYYDYLINNNNSVKCYYSINNNNFIEDEDCTDQSNTYSVQLNNNGNITWEIRDLQNNILYTYSQNFIFNVGNPFINFKDSFNNNFLNLDVLINRYENNDVIEYSINNSQFIQVDYLEDFSVSQNIKYFTINNVNNNDLIIVRVKRNNNIITSARYRANYLKYSNSSNENFNINDIFNKISLNNINEELKNYIKQFGNLILNSKIGNLLLLQTFCLVITIIIKMIRN